MRSLFYSYRCGAGTRAQARFDYLAGRWRRRQRHALRTSFVGVGVLLVVAAGFQQQYLAWGVGLATGAILALYVSRRDVPPPYIEAWRSGAQGERLTARALYALHRTGAVVLHDVPDGGGYIHHVVVSRAGVFLLDSKLLGGDATIDGDSVIVQRPDDEGASYTYDHIASTLRERAVRLKQDIEDHTRVRLRVHAVVVLWPGLAAEVVRGNAVVFISGDQLASGLQEHKSVMSEQMVARIAAGIQRARPQGPSARWKQLPFVAKDRTRAHRSAASLPAQTAAVPAPARSNL